MIAALNEADAIGDVIRALPTSIEGLPIEVVVVDDGSLDQTGSMARAAGALVARHERNLGQGDALRTGFAVAAARRPAIVVTMDADGQHRADQLGDLVKPLIAGDADYVQGTRFSGTYDDAGGARHAGIRIFTRIISAISSAAITDCTNGFRAIRADGLDRMNLREDRFSAPEIILEAAAKGLRMLEVPVHIQSRAAGESKKPKGLGYPLGFLRTIIRVRIRQLIQPQNR